MKYSVCITSYQDDSTIKASLESLLAQLDDRFEVVIADNGGGKERDAYLSDLENRGRIRRVRTVRASRGKGRQIAHEAAKGQYELSSVDTDDVLKAGFVQPILDIYHERCEGRFLVAKGLCIAPRSLINDLGGYADINRGEDNHLWCRAFLKGKYVELPGYDVVDGRAPKRRSLLAGAVSRYGWARDKFRVGVDAMCFYGLDRNPLPLLPLFLLARLDARLRKPVVRVTTWDYALYFGMRRKGMLTLETADGEISAQSVGENRTSGPGSLGK